VARDEANGHVTPPKISVLMAVRDGAPHLQASLASLFAQSLGDFELIVIDDGSQDGTSGILDAFEDRRLVRLHNPEPLGLAGALNRGLEIARGDYIARQDADDISHPEHLALQLAFLEANPKVALLGTAYDVIDEGGRYIETQRQPQDDLAIRWQMLFHNAFCHSSVMIRRAALEERRLRYNAQLPFAQDYDLWSRLLETNAGANLPRPLVSLRLHAGSMSGSGKTAQQDIATRIAAEAIRSLLGRALDRSEIDGLRACYYTSAPLQAAERARLLGLYVELCGAFAHRYHEAVPAAATARYWIERFLLAPGNPNAAMVGRAFIASPLATLRALLKRALLKRAMQGQTPP
jgi:glycosyltransferase involved in cell wall biosynthesis